MNERSLSRMRVVLRGSRASESSESKESRDVRRRGPGKVTRQGLAMGGPRVKQLAAWLREVSVLTAGRGQTSSEWSDCADERAVGRVVDVAD